MKNEGQENEGLRITTGKDSYEFKLKRRRLSPDHNPQLRPWFEDYFRYAARTFENSWRARRSKKTEKETELSVVGKFLVVLAHEWLFRSKSKVNSESKPPFNAEYLLYLFLRREERDAVIGDLVECYGRVFRQFGKRRANIWFYKQVAVSLFPLLRRAILRIAAFAWLGRILRRLVS
jgi:hypothetical protein